jgi:hypothetical protein
MGFQTILIAFVADLLAANRRLLEEQRQRALQVDGRSAVSATREPGNG